MYNNESQINKVIHPFNIYGNYRGWMFHMKELLALTKPHHKYNE